jgi:uncharacterized glyoxalase superfamily protein PhnB/uncharacterized protein YndB with AHSA1/START domain
MAFSLTVSRTVPLSPAVLYRAWTTGLASWFAEPDSFRLTPAVGAPFFFEVGQRFADGTPMQRHPHHGRVLTLVPDQLVQLSWVTGPGGTGGAETIVSVRFDRLGDLTHVTLTQTHFATEAARDQHAKAWPVVLAGMEERLVALAALDAGLAAERVIGVPRETEAMPPATLIPVRSYPDLAVATAWLCDVLGARERRRTAGDRVQYTLGNGAMIAVQWDAASGAASGGRPPATLMVRVDDVDAVYARAVAQGGVSVAAPADQPSGERQAVLKDPAGHSWTLTQTLA